MMKKMKISINTFVFVIVFLISTTTMFANDKSVNFDGGLITESQGKFADYYVYNEDKEINTINSNVILLVNGQATNYRAIIIDGTTYAPLRAVSDSFDYELSWDGVERSASINSENINLDFYVDTNKIKVDNEYFIEGFELKLIDSLTYIPVRVVSELLGKEVGYFDYYGSSVLPIVWIEEKSYKIDEEIVVRNAKKYYYENVFNELAYNDFLSYFDNPIDEKLDFVFIGNIGRYGIVTMPTNKVLRETYSYMINYENANIMIIALSDSGYYIE